MRNFGLQLVCLLFVAAAGSSARAQLVEQVPVQSQPVAYQGGPAAQRTVLLGDISDVEGVRENQLVGYGLVTGLRGTGDKQQTIFTVQTLANALLKMGVQINPTAVTVKNVAAVFVTATLPAFATPGMKIDVTVSSVGDAKSLEGGVLLLSPLRGPDGRIYAQAQGPLVLGGYSEGTAGQLRLVNMPTTGRVPNGALVERKVAVDLGQMSTVSFVLRNENFTAAHDAAAIINKDLGQDAATAIDGRRIMVRMDQSGQTSAQALISRVQNLPIHIHAPAKVIINERTGTIVLGGDVKLSPVSLLHGPLTIEVATVMQVSQPGPFSNGTTAVVPQTTLNVKDAPAQSIRLDEGADVNELIRGLHAIGASSHDIVAILQAVKAAGGLEADLEVI